MLTISSSEVIITVLLFILSYLVGSIPVGLIFGLKFKKIDIREHGSKNIGATNAIRVLGKKLGLIVFFLDVLKGAFTIILVKYIFEPLGIYHFIFPDFLISLGFVSVVGHIFSIFLKFKGGKAVACSLGVVISLTPLAAICCLLIFILFLYTTGYVSIASTCASLTVFFTSLILYFFGNDTFFLINKPNLVILITYFVLVTIIIIKHKKNYIRLLNHTENNFKRKSA